MILNLLLSIAFASPLLVKAPNANSHDFFVYAQNNEVQKISNETIACSIDLNLQSLLKEAQFHFLNSSLEKSRTLFQKIADNKWSCDWKDDERKVISFSFFRLAQISKNDSEQIQYLTDAVNFDDALTPDDVLFPPPVVDLYNKIKKDLVKKSITLPEFAKKYSYILRNGKFISLSTPVIEAYTLRARYTFVSDTYKTETYTSTASDLVQTSLVPEPWVKGDCKNFELSNEILALNKDTKVFFDKSCIADTQVARGESFKTNTIAQMQPGHFPTELPTSNKKTWIQRNYLWVGAAIVGSLLIAHQIHENQQEQTVTVPTTTFNNQ